MGMWQLFLNPVEKELIGAGMLVAFVVLGLIITLLIEAKRKKRNG